MRNAPRRCLHRNSDIPPPRRVLSWRLSNTLDARFCVEALTEALERYGPPEIFNTDQGSQFTSLEFTSVLKDAGVAISMDGRGRCMDNIFIERLWRSLKYEAVYLHELTDGFAAQRTIANWLHFYNTQRPHSALAGSTPAEAYDRGLRWSRKTDRLLRCIPPTEGGKRDEHTTTVQRGVQGEGGAGALRGDKTVQEIAARHKIHPNIMKLQGLIDFLSKLLL